MTKFARFDPKNKKRNKKKILGMFKDKKIKLVISDLKKLREESQVLETHKQYKYHSGDTNEVL